MFRSRALVILVIAMVAATGCSGGGSGRSSRPFDATFERMDATPGRRSFADYRGTPVVVNFFASTCVPCVTEMPTLEKVHQRLGPNVAFVGVDVSETVEAGRSFLATVKVTWDIGRDPKGDLVEAAGGIGLPTTLVLDRQGYIVWRHVGAIDDVDDLTGALRDNHLIG